MSTHREDFEFNDTNHRKSDQVHWSSTSEREYEDRAQLARLGKKTVLKVSPPGFIRVYIVDNAHSATLGWCLF